MRLYQHLDLRPEIEKMLRDPSPWTYRPAFFVDLNEDQQEMVIETFKRELYYARREKVPLGPKAATANAKELKKRDKYIAWRLQQITYAQRQAALKSFGCVVGFVLGIIAAAAYIIVLLFL